MSVFQVMTLDNWTQYLYNSKHSTGSFFLPSAFFITVIVIGNFFFLNLILAVLIKAFGNTKLDEEIPQEKL